jgi:Tol biopolymer transport system component
MRGFRYIILLFFPVCLCSCEKIGPSPDKEDFNFASLTGKIAFPRSQGKIIILDGDNKTSKCLETKDQEALWVDSSVSLSPDGKVIVYSACANDGYQIYKMSADGGNYTKLTKSISGYVEHYICPVWSYDGQIIYYVENGLILLGTVYSIRPDGSDRQHITDFSVYRSISVSKNKDFIVYAGMTNWTNNSQGIAQYNFQDSEIKEIITYDNTFRAYSPEISPDGQKLAYVLRHGPNEHGDPPYYFRILTINLDGTGETLVKELQFKRYVIDTFVRWSPDGTKLAYNFGGESENESESHIFIINSDGTNLIQVTNISDYDGAPSWIK